jgi:hypothetical protein
MTSLDVAQCGLTCRPAAVIMAGRSLMWPCACGRWLPVISLARLMFESQDPMRSPDRESSNDLTRINEARACGGGRRPMRRGSQGAAALSRLSAPCGSSWARRGTADQTLHA